MKKLSTAAVAAVTVLALASCGKAIESTTTAGKPAAPSSSTSGNFPTPNAADLQTSDVPVSDATSEPAPPQQIRFGETWEWEDGVTVNVSKPTKFTPSQFAAGGGNFKTHVMFTITLKNGSKEKLSLIGTPTVMSGDTEGESVFDTDKGLNSTPDSKIQPGRTVKFKVGYGVKSMDDLVLEYAPTFDHDDATFTSK